MALRVLVIAVIITVLSIGVVSAVRGKDYQGGDKQEETIKKLDEILKNQETIMRDLKFIKNKV